MLPFDVIRGHIFLHLSLPQLVLCCFVSTQWKKVSSSVVQKQKRAFRDTFIAQRTISELLFEDGFLSVLQWFQKHLQYPSNEYSSVTQLKSAARGTIYVGFASCV
jgi:hypothetical protein